jgi:hypothetical protein
MVPEYEATQQAMIVMTFQPARESINTRSSFGCGHRKTAGVCWRMLAAIGYRLARGTVCIPIQVEEYLSQDEGILQV